MSDTDPLRLALQTTLGAAYTLERELGGGGMSRVFVARDESLGRDVVVKVLAPELAQGLSAERFTREIRLAAGLQEPHIVPVLAAGVTGDGLPYYTMPFVRGESLRRRIAANPLPMSEALAVLRNVAQALAYAHRQGVVHRDVKPENVLLHEGTAVVTDFGIAKALSASRTQAPDGPAGGTLTQLGTSLGTPAYMAPEQAAGDAVDARADVYAWGVMAYELLAGRHPFAGRTSAQQLIAAHIAEVPASLGVAAPTMPTGLVALVMRCLAKDPAERPAEAGALLVALDAAAGGPQTARATAASVPTPDRRAAPLALAVAALALLGGGVWAWRAHAASSAASDGPPLVAVLPFETAGGAVGVVPDSAFADGLGDAITGKLARLQGLRVIDRASVRSVDDAAAHPQAAGRSLGADFVLRATLRWARGADGEPRVQVSPVLVRVADGTTRWAGDPSVVSPSDPFTVQSTLAAAVAEALDVALAPAERVRLDRPPTTDTAAFAAAERGGRLLRDMQIAAPRPQDFVPALREFERAYQRDPQYADAWGEAADALQSMAQRGAPPALYDSAAVLARRALALDPGQPNAVNALGVVALARGHPSEARELAERAARAFPSSAALQGLLADVRYQSGDTAGVAEAVARAAALAPRSGVGLLDGARAMLALRRYDDARDLIARARAVDPDAPSVQRATGRLALAVGDTAGVSAAVRALRAGGPPTVELLDWMRHGDAALQQELATLSLAALRASSFEDSSTYYGTEAELAMTRGEAARARALSDSGFRVMSAHVAASPAGSTDAAYWSRWVAWFAAVRGDRPAAAAAIRRGATDPLIAGRAGGTQDADQTCSAAQVYAVLGDVDTTLPLLRRCLTMPNGLHLADLGMPEFARLRDDPRVRALAAEVAAAQARARSAPVASKR